MVGLICSDRLNGRLLIEAKSSSSHWSLALSQHRADAFTISCPHAQMLWMSVCLVLAVWSLISFHSRFEFLSSHISCSPCVHLCWLAFVLCVLCGCSRTQNSIGFMTLRADSFYVQLYFMLIVYFKRALSHFGTAGALFFRVSSRNPFIPSKVWFQRRREEKKHTFQPARTHNDLMRNNKKKRQTKRSDVKYIYLRIFRCCWFFIVFFVE